MLNYTWKWFEISQVSENEISIAPLGFQYFSSSVNHLCLCALWTCWDNSLALSSILSLKHDTMVKVYSLSDSTSDINIHTLKNQTLSLKGCGRSYHPQDLKPFSNVIWDTGCYLYLRLENTVKVLTICQVYFVKDLPQWCQLPRLHHLSNHWQYQRLGCVQGILLVNYREPCCVFN